ncbi:hypothetical protein MUB18_20580 [Sphingobacterium sp. PCS056]|uniref:hypothetical protein n=1 Tax=Sphingobacterium sp. PCS056 TaxID=2931400 RepID=UPI00200DFDAA|nr:hypothetical protein [Sphingobacterium sp. PCS056]UPZ36485.1 hypothetical protein MUB18_20580 [Sphingobacterium sp. PCS056]
MKLSDEQEKLYQLRRKGVLPEIELPGQVYVVDWPERVLRAKDRIDVAPLVLSERKRNFYADIYFFYYNTVEKKFVDLDMKLTMLPKDVMIIKIPGGLQLDPVGVAREYGIDEKKFVKDNPLSERIVADAIPLTMTNLITIAERNRVKELLAKIESEVEAQIDAEAKSTREATAKAENKPSQKDESQKKIKKESRRGRQGRRK